MIGALGSIVFDVSHRYIKTISDLSKSISARYTAHEVIFGKPIQEFSGAALETASFKIVLLNEFSGDPQKCYKRLKKYCTDGEVLRFVFGGKLVGRRWVIKSISTSNEMILPNGVTTQLEIDVELEEYN